MDDAMKAFREDIAAIARGDWEDLPSGAYMDYDPGPDRHAMYRRWGLNKSNLGEMKLPKKKLGNTQTINRWEKSLLELKQKGDPDEKFKQAIGEKSFGAGPLSTS